jgi:hypothetical protein
MCVLYVPSLCTQPEAVLVLVLFLRLEANPLILAR